MSSGFVSGGSIDNPIPREEEWLAAKQEIEANRRRNEEESHQEGGKSLYEVLQNNKAAKQEAFEESIKLKNQFRNLDEDEIEFLDSVLESTRAKEEAVRKETTEQLGAFRRQQEEADRSLRETNGGKDLEEAGSPTAGESIWTVGRSKKRKRVKDKDGLKGVKLRKASSSIHNSAGPGDINQGDETHPPGSRQSKSPPPDDLDTESKREVSPRENAPTEAPYTSAKPTSSIPELSTGLGLAGYSSDDNG